MQQTDEGVILSIKVTPKAGRNEVVGWEEMRLRVRVAAVPDKGAGNQELVRLLAKHFGVGRSSIAILSGATCRLKRVLVKDCTAGQLSEYLPPQGTPE